MANSMLKIRRPLGRLIFNMGIAIPGKTVFLIETAPCKIRTVVFRESFLIPDIYGKQLFEASRNFKDKPGDKFIWGT